MIHPEADLQIQCVEWFRIQYPNRLIHHSPNGGRRSAREGARFKRMGTLSGFPDLFIPEQISFYGGMFVELKFGKGSLTPNQRDMIRELNRRDYYAVVARSLDEFIELVNTYFKDQPR